jgi:hypothetical protein
MPLEYDMGLSEATLSLDAQNWAVNGIQTLSLSFYGAPDNTGQLYLKINGVELPFDGDAAAISSAMWTEWIVDLDAVGTDLTRVNALTIGIRDAGALGVLYLDGIRLAAQAPETQAPQDPADSLVAYYALENNIQDSSGNDHDGATVGDPVYVAGVKGMGLSFDGLGGQYVDLGTYNPSAGTGQLSVSLWTQWQGLTGLHQGLMGKRTTWSAATMMWHLEIHKTTGTLAFRQKGSTPDIGSPVLPVGEWAHLGVSYDGQTVQVFLNGQQTGSGAFAFGSDPDSALVLGAVQADGSSLFNGALDEVRLYDRGLSEAELLHLMSDL